MSNKVWDDKHKKYAEKAWINKPNIFAEEIVQYLPNAGRLLDIGGGQGQDSRFFAGNGFNVVNLDISAAALEESKAKIPDELAAKIEHIEYDASKGLPFEDESFDVVYAHQSLHYFDAETTAAVFTEINRILRPGGVLAFFANSTSDPEYNNGEKLEEDYYFVDGKAKRFFSVESARKFAGAHFDEILCDNMGEGHKDSEKGVHNLIRYVGKKP
jgi:SAM-dependent methyltransferase